MLGVGVDVMSITCFDVAYIMGEHFHAGQWGRRSSTCSSVITCVINGRSIYGYVRKFFTVDRDDCPGYASVTWFGQPSYPRGDNRLEVIVSDDGEPIENEVGCIVRITAIDPSCVVVEPVGHHVYRMMRQSGYDTVRS